jgi:hypothetical protein
MQERTRTGPIEPTLSGMVSEPGIWDGAEGLAVERRRQMRKWGREEKPGLVGQGMVGRTDWLYAALGESHNTAVEAPLLRMHALACGHMHSAPCLVSQPHR